MSFVDWIKEYDLFLFDFDGLLVDTEILHFKAYQKMCLDRGFHLSWDFRSYCSFAHVGATQLRDALYIAFPKLYEQEPNWSILHQEKQKVFLEILSKEGVNLMPGVKEVLKLLKAHKKKSCVVTHSPSSLTQEIKKNHPILQTLSFWVTREQYLEPKPAPDSYQTAIRLYGAPGDKMIGFEDSLRGLEALQAACVDAVVVSSLFTQEQIEGIERKGACHFVSFEPLILL